MKCHFGETFGNQKRLKMSFYFLNVILGIFWQIYFFLESVVLGRFLGIRSDPKCLLNVILDRKCISKIHFGEILTDIFFPTICGFGEIFGNQKRPKMSSKCHFGGSELTDQKHLKCHFGETFGNQKRPKISF